MTRPMSVRGLPVVPTQQQLTPVEFVLGSTGVDYYNTPASLAEGTLARATNFDLYRSTLRLRNGIKFIGNVDAPSRIIHAFDFVTSDGVRYTVRVTKVGVDIYNRATGVWAPVVGVNLTGLSGNKVTYAGWNDKLLISNGINGLWEITPSNLTGSQIVGAPQGHQLTVFNGRVILVSVDKMSWSVKNNNQDFAGLGSGYEDLRSTPGGLIGGLRGLYLLTDDTALLVRADSVWQVSTTGIDDAPFRFSRILPSLGAPSPYGLVSTPFGVAGLFNNGIFLVNQNGPTDIGSQLSDHTLANIRSDYLTWAVYDSFNSRLHLLVYEGTSRIVWTYSMRRKGWTRKEYSASFDTADYTEYKRGSILTDDLVGTTDSLVGLTDELGMIAKEHGMILHDGLRVYREDSSLTIDTHPTAVTQTQSELRTGLLHKNPAINVTLHQLNLVYESDFTFNLHWNVTRDGQAFTAWSSMTLGPTTRPTPIMIKGSPISGKYMQVQCLIDGFGPLQLESLVAWISTDGEST